MGTKLVSCSLDTELYDYVRDRLPGLSPSEVLRSGVLLRLMREGNDVSQFPSKWLEVAMRNEDPSSSAEEFYNLGKCWGSDNKKYLRQAEGAIFELRKNTSIVTYQKFKMLLPAFIDAMDDFFRVHRVPGTQLVVPADFVAEGDDYKNSGELTLVHPKGFRAFVSFVRGVSEGVRKEAKND